jgi:uncharacterized Zn-binding protein involved in type VI secretion
MPAAALSEGQSQVECTDGAKGPLCSVDPPKWLWTVDTIQASHTATVTTVMIEGFAPVVFGDEMVSHPWGEPCTPSPVNHSPTLNTILGSPNVYAGGKLIARIGDKYNSESFDHTISTGASTVFIG